MKFSKSEVTARAQEYKKAILEATKDIDLPLDTKDFQGVCVLHWGEGYPNFRVEIREQRTGDSWSKRYTGKLYVSLDIDYGLLKRYYESKARNGRIELTACVQRVLAELEKLQAGIAQKQKELELYEQGVSYLESNNFKPSDSYEIQHLGRLAYKLLKPEDQTAEEPLIKIELTLPISDFFMVIDDLHTLT